MSTIKVADTYLDRMAAKAAANPAKAAIYQAKVDAKIATWIAAGRTVTNDGATITSYTIPTSSSGGGSSSTSATGSSYTLSTSVDGISGTSNNDTIAGILAATGTYSVGDNINGGSGTDVLNLIAISGTSAPFASIDGVETINIRVLDTADETELSAVDWSGVSLITNISSLAATKLDVSGLSKTTTVKLYGNTDIDIGLDLTSTGGTASLAIVGAGSAGTATTIGSASAGNTANINVDEGGSNFITHVTINVEGSLNLLDVDAGNAVTAMTITGSGNAAIATDDTITSFNAAAASGNIDILFSGASEVAAVGGFGNDTFRFGTSLSNSDTINGGAGTDTLNATLMAFNRTISTTAVEAATFTFTDNDGAVANMTASTITNLTLAAGSAGADANLAGVGSITATIASDDLDDVSIGALTGSTVVLNLGSATGSVTLDDLAVTGASAVTINAAAGSGVSGGQVAVQMTTATIETKALTITNSAGETDLTIAGLTGNSIQTVSITSNGSGAIILTSGLEGNTALTTFTVLAQNSDDTDVTLGGINNSGSALGFVSLNLEGRSGADIVLGAVEFGNGATAAATGTITMVAGNGSDVGTTAMDVTTTGAMTLNLNLTANASGDVRVGNVTMNAGTAATASTATLNINASVAAAGSVGVEAVNFDGSTAGGQVIVSAVTVGTSAGLILLGGSGLNATDVANVDVQALTITLGADASANIAFTSGIGASSTGTQAGIDTTAGAVGQITLNVGDSASAVIGAMFVSALEGLAISGSGDAAVRVAGITGADAIGAIRVSVEGEADLDVGAISGSGTLGAISVFAAASASADFDSIDMNSLSTITVSGAGFVDFGTISASAVGTIDARGLVSGTFNIDLRGVDSAVEIYLGNSTNTVISGKGNDVITLTTGSLTGGDRIQYASSNANTDQIINFGAGSTGGDEIEFVLASLATGINAGDGSALAAASTAAFSTGGGAAFTFDDNVILLTGAYASTAAMLANLTGNATLGSALADGASANYVVVWTNGTDSFVSFANVEGGSTGAATTLTLASASAVNLTTLTQINSVSAGLLVTANFDFV